jgi:hypothetical protein
MPVQETTPDTLVILLASVLALLLVLTLLAWRIARSLRRIERAMADGGLRHENSEGAPSASESAPGGAFESFLCEAPARRALPKAEQFAAYRRWRQEKGLNWSGPSA